MSDETPGVHYQISITGRQAAAFFLVLLVALGLAFFFGMKTGAGGRAAAKGATVAQAVDVPAPPPGPAAAKPTEDARPGFGDAARESEPSRAPSPLAAAEAGKSAPPKPTAPLPAPTAAPAKPTAPPPKPTAPPAKPTATPKTAAKKEGPFYVQVLATQKADVADDLNKKLRSDGFPSDVTAVPGKAGWFRVRVGPYADRAKADAAAGKIQKIEKTKHRPIVVP